MKFKTFEEKMIKVLRALRITTNDDPRKADFSKVNPLTYIVLPILILGFATFAGILAFSVAVVGSTKTVFGDGPTPPRSTL